MKVHTYIIYGEETYIYKFLMCLLYWVEYLFSIVFVLVRVRLVCLNQFVNKEHSG
jgi:hypothetical protein